MKLTILLLTVVMALMLSADWPPTIDGHQIYDNSIPIIKLEKTGDNWVFPGTIEVDAIVGVSVEVDLTPYTKRDGTQPPTAPWDFNAFDLTNVGDLTVNNTIECWSLKAITLEIGTTSALVWFDEVTGKLYLKDGNVEINITDLDDTINLKADAADVYTTAEVDATIEARIAATTIEELADTDISSPVTGQHLKWNGTDWENSTEALLVRKIENIGTGNDSDTEYYLTFEPVGNVDVYFDNTHVAPDAYTVTAASKLITFVSPPYQDAIIDVSYDYPSAATASLPIRTVYYSPDYADNLGEYRTRSVGGTGNFNYTFYIPPDFTELVSLYYIAVSGATATGLIDLTSNYCAAGENYAAHTETDIDLPISVTDNERYNFHLESVFSSLSPDDICGVNINFKGGIGTQSVMGIVLQYK